MNENLRSYSGLYPPETPHVAFRNPQSTCPGGNLSCPVGDGSICAHFYKEMAHPENPKMAMLFGTAHVGSGHSWHGKLTLRMVTFTEMSENPLIMHASWQVAMLSVGFLGVLMVGNHLVRQLGAGLLVSSPRRAGKS